MSSTARDYGCVCRDDTLASSTIELSNRHWMKPFQLPVHTVRHHTRGRLATSRRCRGCLVECNACACKESRLRSLRPKYAARGPWRSVKICVTIGSKHAPRNTLSGPNPIRRQGTDRDALCSVWATKDTAANARKSRSFESFCKAACHLLLTCIMVEALAVRECAAPCTLWTF